MGYCADPGVVYVFDCADEELDAINRNSEVIFEDTTLPYGGSHLVAISRAWIVYYYWLILLLNAFVYYSTLLRMFTFLFFFLYYSSPKSGVSEFVG